MFALILEGISEHLGSVVFTRCCDYFVQVSAPIHAPGIICCSRKLAHNNNPSPKNPVGQFGRKRLRLSNYIKILNTRKL